LTFNYKFSKMKNRNIFIALAIIAFGFSACTDHSGHTTVTPQTELNINYKAAFVVNGGNANLSVIDLSTNVAKDQITLVGTFPHHISTPYICIAEPQSFGGRHDGRRFECRSCGSCGGNRI
jgi:hypothetical protein